MTTQLRSSESPQVSGLDETTAIIISLMLSVSYVAVIYVNKPKNAATLKNGIIDRNDPVVARDRVRKIILFSIATLAILPIVLSVLSNVPVLQIYYQLGIIPGFKYDKNSFLDWKDFAITIGGILKSLLLVILLFIGPLLDYLFFESDSSFFQDLKDQLSTIQGKRDLIVGPLTEEVIYTSCIIVILLQVTDITVKKLIFLPPAFFSIAHFHHAYELSTKGTIPLTNILLMCSFQLFYTFLFGTFTNYLFLRGGSMWGCFVVHVFCNFMGFPKLSGFTNKLWGTSYYGLLGVGIWLFKRYLRVFTENPLELVKI